MLLAGPQIARRLSDGTRASSNDDLVIRPVPNTEILRKSSAASVDLRLGCWFTTMRQSRVPLLHVDDDAARIAAKAQLTPDQLEILQDYVPTALSVSAANLSKTHYAPFV